MIYSACLMCLFLVCVMCLFLVCLMCLCLVCFMCSFQFVLCVVFSVCYVQFLVCLVPSFRYRTLLASLASRLATLAFARSARIYIITALIHSGINNVICLTLIVSFAQGPLCGSRSLIFRFTIMSTKAGGAASVFPSCCLPPRGYFIILVLLVQQGRWSLQGLLATGQRSSPQDMRGPYSLPASLLLQCPYRETC